MIKRCVSKKAGFTLIELLTVAAVIGILLGLLLSAVQSVRGSAAKIACANNIRQIGHASHLYHDQYGQLPPAYASARELGKNNDLTWPVRLLPFLEQDNLYNISLAAHRIDAIDFHNPPHIGLATVVKVYTCPADGRLVAPITDDKGYTAAYGSFVGIAGSDRANGAMRAESGVRFSEILDGTSNTLLFGEKQPWGRYLDGNWYTITVPRDAVVGPGISYLTIFSPTGTPGCDGTIRFGPGLLDNPCDVFHFWSLHSGGANFAFADGSVRFLRYSAADILPALATRAGGEVVTLPD
jgi:prepilin-type N-terminal cleavage/methylation domain-containing protein/prepilin-type processing-associated H-X9-DG protein